MPLRNIDPDQVEAAVTWLIAEYEKRPSRKLGRSNPGMRLLKNSAEWYWLNTNQRRAAALLAKERWEAQQAEGTITMDDVRAVKARRQNAAVKNTDDLIPDTVNYPPRVRRKDSSLKVVNVRPGLKHGTRYAVRLGCECLYTPDTQPQWWDHSFVPAAAVRYAEPGCEPFETRRQRDNYERRFANAETRPYPAVPRREPEPRPLVPEPRSRTDLTRQLVTETGRHRLTASGRHRKIVGRHA